MKLTWYGHASFGIASTGGVSIVTDPYDPKTSGYKPYPETADIVVRSSANDSFHCNAHLVPGDPIVIDALELARSGSSRTEKGVTFTAVESMEALDHREHNPDDNAMYRFSVDGVAVGHMGDVGNPLSSAQLAFFDGIDVLLALAGGHPTIALEDLKDVIDEVRPRLVVPMHFRTPAYRLDNILPLEAFLALFPEDLVDFAGKTEIEIDRDGLPGETRILVLENL
jgi:L-ascorbate metabolism protein UlaG (beta-lactamase superfamily)